MPGMMRSRKSGCMCVDCAGPRCADRASEKREFERLVDAEIERWREALDLMARWPEEDS